MKDGDAGCWGRACRVYWLGGTRLSCPTVFCRVRGCKGSGCWVQGFGFKNQTRARRVVTQRLNPARVFRLLGCGLGTPGRLGSGDWAAVGSLLAA